MCLGLWFPGKLKIDGIIDRQDTSVAVDGIFRESSAEEKQTVALSCTMYYNNSAFYERKQSFLRL